MKKIYAALILLSPLLSVAQITVTSADFPAIGTTTIFANDTSYNAALTPGGANQVWNYSSLQNQLQDTSAFTTTTGTPYIAQFPTANIATYSSANGYTYFTSNTTGFYLNGKSDGTVANTLKFNPALMYVPAPFTYQDMHTDNARIQVDSTVGAYDIRYVHHVQSTFEGDGFGSLQLPNATYANTLRIKIIEISYDSNYYAPAGTGNYALLLASASRIVHYRWIRNGNPGFLFGIEADSAGTTATSASYILSATVGLPQIDSPTGSLQVFPNPANDKVHVLLPELLHSVTLTITDEQGRMVEQLNRSKNDLWLDVSRYTAGWYLISADSDVLHYTTKLLVKKTDR